MRVRVHRSCAAAAAGLLSLLLAMPQGAAAQATLERIKLRGQVNVGYRVDTAPFALQDAAGKPAGYALEFCAPLAQKLKEAAAGKANRINYVALSADEVLRDIKNGSVDLFCSGVSHTTERESYMAFSKPIYVTAVRIAVLKSSAAAAARDLDGKTLAIVDKTTAEKAATQLAQQKDIKWQLAKALDPEAAIGQLKLGWAAGYVRDDALLAAQLAARKDGADYRVLPDTLSVENIAIAFGRGDAQLKALADQTVEEAIRKGDAQRWYERWFMQPLRPGGRALNMPMSSELKALFEATGK